MTDVQVERAQGHFVRPAVRAQVRPRIDDALMEELRAIQAAAALEAGLVSPAPLVVATCPRAQGSPRVTDAATLYKAPTQCSRSSRPVPTTSPPGPRR
jgi:hypothetical protein